MKQYTVKKVSNFAVPSRDVPTKLSLARNNLIIPAGNGKSLTFFTVYLSTHPIPGIPIFLGGCGSPEVIRDLWDMMGWLKHIGKLDLKKGWTALMESFIGGGGGGRGSRDTESLKTGSRNH
jgi:hypothetical protein